MGNKLLFLITLSVFLLGSFAAAQDKAPDPGLPDTASVEHVMIASGSTESFPVELSLYNDEELGGFGLPITWDSPDIICDSVTFGAGSRIDYVMNKPVQIDTLNQKLQVGLIILFEAYVQPGDGMLFTMWFHAVPGAADQVINLDSTSYSAASPFILTLASAQTFVPQYLPGTITIGNPQPHPTIDLSPTELAFAAVEGGADPAIQSFDIANTGDGTLEWMADADQTWIGLTPSSGSGPATVDVAIDISTLTAGDYAGTISVTDANATNSPQTVAVTLHIDPPPPCLSLSTTTLNFSGIDGDILMQPIAISNCGGPTLSWNVSGIDAPWLSVNPTSGTGGASVEFTCNLTGLAPGPYSDVVTITGDAETTNSPQDVTITLEVIDTTPQADTVRVASVAATAGQHVVVDITYQNFISIGAIALPLSFSAPGVTCDSVSFVGSRVEYMEENISTIDNGAGVLDIVAFPVAQPYLAPGNGLLARLYFSIDAAAATQIVAIDSVSAPSVNDYLFTDTNGSVRPTLCFAGSMDITGLPVFDISTAGVNFSAELGTPLPSQYFDISNTGYGILDWSVTDDAGWLTVTPVFGGAGTVEFAVDTVGLAEGIYNATATFTSNALNSPVDIPVSLNWFAVPELAVAPLAFNFGQVCRGNLVSGEFDISNVGTGSLDWTASSTADVSLTPASGTAVSGMAATGVAFEINTESMDYGPQTVAITIEADGVAGSPRTILASMNLANCDDCTFDIAEVDGMQGLTVAVPVYAYQVSNVAAVEFHLSFPDDILDADSVTSDYMTGPTVGYIDAPLNEIHYIWDNLSNPISVPDGEPIMVMWFTVIGDIGTTVTIDWMEANEIVDPMGIPIPGIGYCEGTVTVVEPRFDIFGNITYYDKIGRAVEGVTIDLNGPDVVSAMTDANGHYEFQDVLMGQYTITPSRDVDDPGASVADIITIRRHLAYVERFSTPYQMIAADVNLSNTVSVADVVVMRRYLAQLETLPSGNWTFVVWDFGITMSNWYLASSLINEMLTGDLASQNFYGIRMGDVNASWGTTLFAKPMYAATNPGIVEFGENRLDGDRIMVPVLLSDIDEMAGLELHLDFNADEVIFAGLASDVLGEVTYGADNGSVHLVWEDLNAPVNLSSATPVVELAFTTRDYESTGNISVTAAEAVNTAGLSYRLEFGDAGSIGGAALPAAYSLEQNSPNPFNPVTTIRATMGQPGDYTLTVYNVVGQGIRTYQGYSEAGTIEFIWDGADENGLKVASGIYLYKFETGMFHDTKKMVLLK